MNEAEYRMKNYGDRGGCYRPRRITPSKISVVVNFLSQVIFLFLLFLGMLMYANEV